MVRDLVSKIAGAEDRKDEQVMMLISYLEKTLGEVSLKEISKKLHLSDSAAKSLLVRATHEDPRLYETDESYNSKIGLNTAIPIESSKIFPDVVKYHAVHNGSVYIENFDIA